MNSNAVIAVLVLKGIITKDEGEKLVEYLNNRPQSTMLSEVLSQVGEFITEVKQDSNKVAKIARKALDTAEKAASDVEEKIKADAAAIDNEEKALTGRANQTQDTNGEANKAAAAQTQDQTQR